MSLRSALLALAVAALGAAAFDADAVAGGTHFLEATGAARAPVGQIAFCKANASACRPAPAADPIELTEARWRTLVAINGTVNREIMPVSDADLYGEDEVWTVPSVAGDCEDYVLLKRERLIAAGFAPAGLMVAVVFDENREGHAVLLVRTDRGDLVLDNKTDSVVLWSDTRYEFVKRESSGDPRRWVRVSDPRFNPEMSATLR